MNDTLTHAMIAPGTSRWPSSYRLAASLAIAGTPRLPSMRRSAITRTFAARLKKGCRGGGLSLTSDPVGCTGAAGPFRIRRLTETSQMPKMKTKSGAKKRFKITGSGKVVSAQAGKRHGMIKRTTKQIRQLRGTNVLFKTDGDNIKKYWLPNG